MNNKKIVVLLTASIMVNNVPFVTRKDTKLRAKDYEDSLKKWANIDVPIIFCENTGTSLEFLYKVQSNYNMNNLEFISFNGNQEAKSRGKGYGELKIIDYAIKNSKFIFDDSFVIKVTGRFYLKNIDNYIKWLYKIDEPFVNVNFIKNMKLAESRVFGFQVDFFKRYLYKYQHRINDFENYFFEHALRDATLEAILDGNLRLPLPIFPVLVGYSGTFGSKVKISFFKILYNKLKYNISLSNYYNS